MQSNRFFRLHRVPSTFLSLKIALFLLAGELMFGSLGYVILEGYSLGEAFYMMMLTISTVGFSEVRPLSEAGRMFTSLIILLNIGVIAYLLAVFSYYVIEGEIFKSIYSDRMKDKINALQDHIILCGYGKYGKEIALNLNSHQTPFVVIDINPDEVEQLQHSKEEVLFLQGDATQDEMLVEAGIDRARGLISALSEDSDNLFIVLSARQLNPRLKIISRAMQPRSQPKLIKAGANHVVMPENIGGFYMATLVNKPGAVEFFSFITNEYHSDIGFEELKYFDLPEKYRGQAIKALELRPKTGANIIGYRDQLGEYYVNPDPETILEPGASFIVLGSAEQLKKLRAIFQSDGKG